nr:MAG TPA: minor tail protein [Caudoviricetes sp.]
MVEELKLAIKIDDASIEQSLLKQFANAQKMADKVVLDFKNVNFDDKQIEAKFKEMQKKAGQNPIDLTINGNTLDMLGQIDKRLTEIFSIGKGKSFIDSSSIAADIGKIENKINELNKKYEESQKKLSSIGSGGISGKDVNLVDNKEFQKLSQEVSELKNQFGDLKTHMQLLDDYTVPTDRFFELQSQVETTTVKVSDLVEEFTKLSNAQKALSSTPQESNISSGRKDAFPDKDISASVESATNSIKEENNVLEQNTQKVKENTQAKEQNANINLNKYDKRLDSYNGKVDKYQATIARFNEGGWTSDTYLKNVQAVRDAVKQYATLLDNIKTNQNGIASDKDIQNLDRYEKKIKDTIATVTNMSASEKGYNFVSGQKELDKIHKLLNENSNMSAEAKTKIKSYYAEIESGNPSMSLDRIHGEIMKIYNAEVEAGRAGRSFFDTLKNSGFHQLATQMAGMFGFYDVINVVKEGIGTIRELDTALTEMRKVSNESVSTLKSYQSTTFDTADAVGTTAKQLQVSTADWMRLGESINDAAESAKDANILFNVSEFDSIDEATESLVSMSQAYKDLGKMDIIDVLNNIGNNYSISTDGLATALKDSASALVTANNDLNEAVALTTAGNAITQDPSKVGAGLRTISLRLVGTQSAKEELESLGEDTTDVITTVSKLRDTIMEATKAATEDGKGFDILDENGNYKSTYEIMQGLADLYDKIVEKDKELGTNNLNLLLETIAGKNRSNIAASILQNGEMLRSVFEDAQNSSGSAENENKAYLESVEGRIKRLQNKIQQFWATLIDSNVVKEGVDFLDAVTSGVTKIVDKVNLIPIAISAIYSVMNNGGGLIRLIINFINNSPFLASVEFSREVYEFI